MLHANVQKKMSIILNYLMITEAEYRFILPNIALADYMPLSTHTNIILRDNAVSFVLFFTECSCNPTHASVLLS